MGAAFDGMDIIGVAENCLVYRVGPLQRNFYVVTVADSLEENDFVQRVATLVERFDELPNAALIMELLLFAGAFVAEPDFEPGIEVGHLAQVARYSVVF